MVKFHWLHFSAVTVLTVCAACSKKGEEAASASTASDQTQAQTELAGPATELGALIDLMVAEAANLPREEFDPAALAKKLGSDPQAHFEWVRDHTSWAPYRGLLRGSGGVMLDRVGSNLDRAVLLGDLLRRSGHTVRLAHAGLTESRARELLPRVRPFPDLRREPPMPKSGSAERRRKFETMVPGREKALQAQIADSKRHLADANALTRSQAGQLYAAVKDAAKPSDDDSHAIAALRDHWWVEREAKGRWIAMDMLLPNAKAGDTLASASNVIEWKKDAASPSIADSDWHTVQIRVVVEHYGDGVTTEATVLETILRPADLLDRPVTLFHKPKPWPENLPNPRFDPNAVGNAAVSVREWVPVLRVGSDFIAQSGFSESGGLIVDPLSTKRDVVDAGGAGFMEGFGETLGGDEAADSSLTAEWVDYEVHVPGQSVQRLRRPVFDVLGPANREGKTVGFDANTNARLIARYEALLGTTDILLQPCNFTEDFLAHLMSKGLIAEQAAIRELAREQDAAKARSLATAILGRIENWGPLPHLVFWRSELSGQPSGWFIDRPNVLNYRVGRRAVSADRMAFRELIDVATNATGVRQGAKASSFEIRLRQGVADTVAEILSLGVDVRKAENTASLFAMADLEAAGNQVIGPRDMAAVEKLEWPPDVAARIAADVKAGFMVVALGKPVSINERERLGWWRVDPVSGDTIGVMDTGFHAVMADNVEIRAQINALESYLSNNAAAIEAARNLPVLTPGQSLLLRTAQAAEAAIARAGLPW